MSAIAKRIVEKILDNLNDRRGIEIDSFDNDIQEEIQEALENIVDEELAIEEI